MSHIVGRENFRMWEQAGKSTHPEKRSSRCWKPSFGFFQEFTCSIDHLNTQRTRVCHGPEKRKTNIQAVFCENSIGIQKQNKLTGTKGYRLVICFCETCIFFVLDKSKPRKQGDQKIQAAIGGRVVDNKNFRLSIQE